MKRRKIYLADIIYIAKTDQVVLKSPGERVVFEKPYTSLVFKELAVRICNIIKVDSTETEIKSLLDKCLPPSNCRLIDSPKLNNGMKRDKNTINRDERIETNQLNTAAALAASQQEISAIKKNILMK